MIYYLVLKKIYKIKYYKNMDHPKKISKLMLEVLLNQFQNVRDRLMGQNKIYSEKVLFLRKKNHEILQNF